MLDDLVSRLTTLFGETGEAHHRAFAESDGADPDWAIWYADYLVDKLPALLSVRLSRSELVYLLMRASYEQQREAPGATWPRFYARFFAERYG